MDLALNNLQKFIFHKTQITKPNKWGKKKVRKEYLRRTKLLEK